MFNLNEDTQTNHIFYLFIFLVFRDRVSLYSPGCPGTHFVDQAGLELRNPPASASLSSGIKGVRHYTGPIFFKSGIDKLNHQNGMLFMQYPTDTQIALSVKYS